jgi:hypothetical protein
VEAKKDQVRIQERAKRAKVIPLLLVHLLLRVPYSALV